MVTFIVVPDPGAGGGVCCLHSNRAGNAAHSRDQEDRAEVRGNNDRNSEN